MKCVIIESPLRGNLHENLQYAYAAVADSLKRGEAPIASHILYPAVLNDDVKLERKQGMEAGWAWLHKADLVAVYIDLGISEGMQDGIVKANMLGVTIEKRKLY